MSAKTIVLNSASAAPNRRHFAVPALLLAASADFVHFARLNLLPRVSSINNIAGQGLDGAMGVELWLLPRQ